MTVGESAIHIVLDLVIGIEKELKQEERRGTGEEDTFAESEKVTGSRVHFSNTPDDV